ncbi:hypothetical protein QQ045_010176 [Rhodiola kirilowii]
MTVSLEALAMAGVDWAEYGKSIEEWEQEDLDMQTPAHLLAEDDDDDEEQEQEEGLGLPDADGLTAVVTQLSLELVKLMKLPSLEDDIVESVKAWWSSKRKCLGADMELNLKMNKIIHALEKVLCEFN